MANFQPELVLKPTDEIVVPPGKGYLIVMVNPQDAS